MSELESAPALRLRGEPVRRARRRSVDAEVSIAPRFTTLLLLGIASVLLQATLFHGLAVRGAHASLVTVLIVWTGLRCGVVTGGWLGLACGILEDALGGGGTNVLSATLVGFLSGTLSNRFFSDSLPIFTFAIAAAMLVRYVCGYLNLEFVYGERGLFHAMSREFVWSAILNCAVGAVALLALRARQQWSLRVR